MIFEVGDKVYARDLKIEGTVTQVRKMLEGWSVHHEQYRK